jgi:hypothetical protein
LYTFFITGFEARLNQIKLAHLVSLIGDTLANEESKLQFYTNILTARTRLGDEAALCLDMDIAVCQMKLGLMEEAKTLIENAKKQLASLSSPEAIVFSKVYGATFEYRKVCCRYFIFSAKYIE